MIDEPREVSVGGLRVPYLDGHRSLYGMRLLTTKLAALELEPVRDGQSDRVVFLRAPDRNGVLADVGKVWIDAIEYVGDELRAEVTLRFRP